MTEGRLNVAKGPIFISIFASKGSKICHGLFVLSVAGLDYFR